MIGRKSPGKFLFALLILHAAQDPIARTTRTEQAREEEGEREEDEEHEGEGEMRSGRRERRSGTY